MSSLTEELFHTAKFGSEFVHLLFSYKALEKLHLKVSQEGARGARMKLFL